MQTAELRAVDAEHRTQDLLRIGPEPRRRLHRTPDVQEIDHCRWWLRQEMALVKPRLVVATHNPGKAREIAVLLGGDFEVLSADQAGLPEPEETESTFVGNAVLNARHAAAASGLPSLADDSGMSVRALGSQPGIY